MKCGLNFLTKRKKYKSNRYNKKVTKNSRKYFFKFPQLKVVRSK